ncbi:metalloprotease TldD [bacterium]|nr:MAG: metalloprotease TldD [bacterium]
MSDTQPETLPRSLIEHLLAVALERGGEHAELFFEQRLSHALRLQEGRIHEAGVSVTRGVGIRVRVGDQQGYGYSDDLSQGSLERAARVAGKIARGGHILHAVSVNERPVENMYIEGEWSDRVAMGRRVDLLLRADAAARRSDARVRAVNGNLADEVQDVLIANSDGLLVRDRRPLVALSVQVVAERNGERTQGYFGDGGRRGFEFYDRVTPEWIAGEAARIAVVNLEAVEAPAGELPVVVGPGGGGVLLHEAVGHGLESDFNRQGVSLYSGRIGERVASELVTIYDDGNLPGERGSIAVDDEGTPGQHKILVEHGMLRGYMQDNINAELMHTHSTGSGRRQSFRYLPQPRMTNTYMPAGDLQPDEVIKRVKRGFYAKSFSGGQVEISKGDFVFMVGEGYLIEDGRLTAPVKGATLIGNGPEIMTRVSAVGSDMKLANGSYTCGKGGQLVPVGVGLPTLLISSMTVGGSRVG